ncbi:amino acid ABC transporter permease [Bradyrhizobium embrapense]|uniref:amino acid ABC transporter permease n=1 Tax=Bradyrhizobium embrapense TaxID=630921 RepID=UPI00067CDEAD|nr:ABC transporter permease subunit [Bradyrhizobium embrapense]
MTWDWAFVIKILPALGIGVWYTVVVTAAASVIALGLGLALAIMESVSKTYGRAFVLFWLELFRGVPSLVLLYFCFYVLPQLGVTVPAIPIGIVVLGVVYAAYCSEVYRGSLITIQGELRDACVALHLRSYTKWRRILVPLMAQRAAPALLNYVLSLFRETAVLFAIGVPVLMGEANDIGYEHFRYLEPYTLAGAIYLAMNLPFLYVLSRFKDKHA